MTGEGFEQLPDLRAIKTKELCAQADVPLSTLNQWVRQGLVTPSIAGSRGRRIDRYWAPEDMVTVRAIVALRAASCPMQQLRRAQDLIREAWNLNLADVVLVWDGSDLVTLKANELSSLIKRPGQQMLHLLSMPLGVWRVDAERFTERIRPKVPRLPDPATREQSYSSPPVVSENQGTLDFDWIDPG